MSRLSTFFWDNDILEPQRSRTLASLGGVGVSFAVST